MTCSRPRPGPGLDGGLRSGILEGGLKPVMTIILPSLFVCHPDLDPDLDLDLVILTWPLTLTWPGPGLGFHPEIHPDILTLTLTLP